MMMKETLNNRWLVRLLLLTFLGLAFFLLKRDPNQYKILLQLNSIEIAALLIVNLISFIITSLVSWHLLRTVSSGVPWSINLALTFLANFLNYFGPAQPGLGAKALYLKAACKIRFTDLAIATGINCLVMLLISGLIGVGVVAWMGSVHDIYLAELGWISLMMTLFVVSLPIFLLWIPQFNESKKRWVRFLIEAITGIRDIWWKRRAMLITTSLIIVQYSVAGMAVWLCYRAIGTELDYPLAILVAAFLSVANIMPLTPNNVGVSELVMGLVTQLSGASFADGLIAGAIMRAIHLLISVLALPYVRWRLKNINSLLSHS